MATTTTTAQPPELFAGFDVATQAWLYDTCHDAIVDAGTISEISFLRVQTGEVGVAAFEEAWAGVDPTDDTAAREAAAVACRQLEWPDPALRAGLPGEVVMIWGTHELSFRAECASLDSDEPFEAATSDQPWWVQDG
ncbi:MAG: hypothetical protein KJO18_01050, partial [Acidimicrobiia bacterium]|nr:hypothetical protein [Acidimicrobiia bacterium]